jgi:hypothetical protein
MRRISKGRKGNLLFHIVSLSKVMNVEHAFGKKLALCRYSDFHVLVTKSQPEI